jgi:hypothetical protein
MNSTRTEKRKTGGEGERGRTHSSAVAGNSSSASKPLLKVYSRRRMHECQALINASFLLLLSQSQILSSLSASGVLRSGKLHLALKPLPVPDPPDQVLLAMQIFRLSSVLPIQAHTTMDQIFFSILFARISLQPRPHISSAHANPQETRHMAPRIVNAQPGCTA